MRTRARVEPRYMSMGDAARRLGLHPSQLSRAARAHPLYAPAIAGIPLGPSAQAVPGLRPGVGARVTRYHVRQVEIIERVLLGVTDLETGWLEWQVERGRSALRNAERRTTAGNHEKHEIDEREGGRAQ